jgi:hypothetical protein
VNTRVSTQDVLFPSFNYYLDDSDPDIWILRRQDDSFVAAYSARGATKESIIEAAREDYRQLIQDLWELPSKTTKEQQSI